MRVYKFPDVSRNLHAIGTDNEPVDGGRRDVDYTVRINFINDDDTEGPSETRKAVSFAFRMLAWLLAGFLLGWWLAS